MKCGLLRFALQILLSATAPQKSAPGHVAPPRYLAALSSQTKAGLLCAAGSMTGGRRLQHLRVVKLHRCKAA